MKIVRKMMFVLVVIFMGIISVYAAEEKEVITNCSSTSNCSISLDKFNFKIKKITIQDKNSKVIANVDDWTINPKAIAEKDDEMELEEVNLGLNIPNIKDIIKKGISSSTFDGYINIEYEMDIKNLAAYTYKLESAEEIFVLLLSADSLLVDSSPFSGAFNYAYVKMDSSGKVDILDTATIEDEDGGTTTTSCMLAIFNTEDKISIDSTSIKGEAYAIASSNLDDLADNINSENNSLYDFDDFSNDNTLDDDIKIVDSADEVVTEKSKEVSPKTSVVSNIILIGLAALSVGLFIFTNKKILKHKI